MEETLTVKERLKDILIKKNFKSVMICNRYLLDAGYPIDEIIEITDDLFNLNQLAINKRNIAANKLEILIAILNDEWKPDWNDPNEKKWYPYFDMRNGQVSFSDTYYFWYITDFGVFSPLLYKTKELAEYGGKKYIELYKEMLL